MEGLGAKTGEAAQLASSALPKPSTDGLDVHSQTETSLVKSTSCRNRSMKSFLSEETSQRAVTKFASKTYRPPVTT